MLAEDPRLDLQDGRFELVEVDRAHRSVTMVINCGDLRFGYRRVTLVFESAEIATRDLSAVADAVGAEFRGNRWHRTRSVTEIVGQLLESGSDGRHRFRLRLHPFGTITVDFGAVSLDLAPLASRGRARAGRFVIDT